MTCIEIQDALETKHPLLIVVASIVCFARGISNRLHLQDLHN